MDNRKQLERDAALPETPAEQTPPTPPRTEPSAGPPGSKGRRYRPHKKFSLPAGDGVYVEAVVWGATISLGSKDVTVYTISCRKSYRREDGTRGRTKHFRGSELDMLAFVLRKAGDFVLAARMTEDPPS